MRSDNMAIIEGLAIKLAQQVVQSYEVDVSNHVALPTGAAGQIVEISPGKVIRLTFTIRTLRKDDHG